MVCQLSPMLCPREYSGGNTLIDALYCYVTRLASYIVECNEKHSYLLDTHNVTVDHGILLP